MRFNQLSPTVQHMISFYAYGRQDEANTGSELYIDGYVPTSVVREFEHQVAARLSADITELDQVMQFIDLGKEVWTNVTSALRKMSA